MTPPATGFKRMLARRQRLKELADTLLSDTQEPGEAPSHDLGRLRRDYLARHRKALALVVLGLLAVACVPYGFAQTHRYLIDTILGPSLGFESGTPGPVPHGLLTGLWLVLAINLFLHTVTLAGNWMSAYFALGIGRDVALRLRSQLYRKLDALQIEYYDRTQTGRIVARVMSDVATIQQTLSHHLPHLLVGPIRLAAGLAVLFWMHWRLASILAAAAPVYAVVFLALRPRIRKNRRMHRRLISRLYGLVSERLGSILVIKASGRERNEAGAFSRQVHDIARLARQRVTYAQGLAMSARAIMTLSIAAVLLLGLLEVRDGTPGATLGSVVAFTQIATQVFMPIQMLATIAAMFQSALVAIRRVFALLDEPAPPASGRLSLKGMQGSVRFDAVTFAYPSQASSALRDVSFRVHAGEHVAVMGPSGGGKSTLFDLLLRFYEPDEGRIIVGGVSLEQVDLSSLRRHIRYVQQEPFVFSGTIAENIAYGYPEASDKAIADAARMVELHDFVMGLPDRYDTVVGEKGIGLSGGQRQRLALATALLTNPEILLLDDTTSALDAETEARIRRTLQTATANRTSLIITQRIVTARSCERIVVLEDGRISQFGTHDELSAVDGFYRRICAQQGSA